MCTSEKVNFTKLVEDISPRSAPALLDATTFDASGAQKHPEVCGIEGDLSYNTLGVWLPMARTKLCSLDMAAWRRRRGLTSSEKDPPAPAYGMCTNFQFTAGQVVLCRTRL